MLQSKISQSNHQLINEPNNTGLEPRGNCIGRPANFKIETFAAGKGEPLVLVKNPRGQPERVSQAHAVAECRRLMNGVIF